MKTRSLVIGCMIALVIVSSARAEGPDVKQQDDQQGSMAQKELSGQFGTGEAEENKPVGKIYKLSPQEKISIDQEQKKKSGKKEKPQYTYKAHSVRTRIDLPEN